MAKAETQKVGSVECLAQTQKIGSLETRTETQIVSSVEALADLSLEQLMSIEVSSTSFFDMSPEKAPGSLYIIPQEQIQKSYASSISDFLEYYVPGVNISRAYSAGSLYS
ncbi:MAG: Plug domain-containing protein, partial [Desulfamplus sp.]|nr:Plug domain-containing protein [Desulfamplus sp.]